MNKQLKQRGRKFFLLRASVASIIFFQLPSYGQLNPSSTASSAANAAGTTVNNQSNAQINTNTFYGFGPGINCPTPTLSLSGFGGSGSGSSAGDSIGAGVNSDNLGAIVSFTIPLGGANHVICKEIGKAQVQALLSQVNRANVEATKTVADINLVTALKCVEIQRVAELRGPFADVCAGVYARGIMQAPFSAIPSGGPGGPVLNRFQSLGQEPSPVPVAQVERPTQATDVASAYKPQPKPAPSDPIWTPLKVNAEHSSPVEQTARTAEAISMEPLKAPPPLPPLVMEKEPMWADIKLAELPALPPLGQIIIQTEKNHNNDRQFPVDVAANAVKSPQYLQ